MRKLLLSAVFFSAVFCSVCQVNGEGRSEKIHPVRKERSISGNRVEFAKKIGAEVRIARDGQNYCLFWRPENYSASSTPHIVSLHGNGCTAYDDLAVWYPYVKDRGYALLAVNWWTGRGERPEDYLEPHVIYRMIDDFFRENGITAPALLHGFSRGSTQLCMLAAMDKFTGRNLFRLFVANAGKPGNDFPPRRALENGKFGPAPLENTLWITYAGGRDPNPERDGIEGMREAGKLFSKLGGRVLMAIEDPEGDHGGFHKRKKNVDRVLDEFDRILGATR